MNGVFHIGATGLHAQDRALEIVANNITNMNTPGFKRAEVRFSELVGATPAAANPGAAPAMLGVLSEGATRMFGPGDIRATGNPMDVAIRGDGFIELAGPDGQTMLWRGGTLGVTADGFLSGPDGMPLKAMIAVPEGATALAIDASGDVKALLPGDTEASTIGHIDLVLVRDMTTLGNVDGGLFRPASDADLVTADADHGGGAFVQGSIEQSNVELTDEMVNLMMMQRAYAASAQVVQAGDQLMAIANGLKR